MQNIKNKIITIILSLSLTITLSNCGMIVGKNINLKNHKKYPKIKKDEIDYISLSFDSYIFDNDVKWAGNTRYSFLWDPYKLTNNFKDKKNNPQAKCTIKAATKFKKRHKGGFELLYLMLTTYTLYTVPFFWIYPNEIKGELIDNKTGKILKKYYLKENTYSLRSPIVFLIPSVKYADVNTAHKIAPDKLTEAFSREVIKDAYNFKECRITDPLEFEEHNLARRLYYLKYSAWAYDPEDEQEEEKVRKARKKEIKKIEKRLKKIKKLREDKLRKLKKPNKAKIKQSK